MKRNLKLSSKRNKRNSPSCQCGKCAGCRLFRPAYRVQGSKVFSTKSEYLNHTHAKEAREIIRLDSRTAKVRKVIDSMSDDGYIQHSHAIPIRLRTKPSPRELEIGIPVCCNHEEMVVSAFTEGVWYCRSCKNTRLR